VDRDSRCGGALDQLVSTAGVIDVRVREDDAGDVGGRPADACEGLDKSGGGPARCRESTSVTWPSSSRKAKELIRSPRVGIR